MKHKKDEDLIANTHNVSRFFVENRQISWVLLVAVLALGVYGYCRMPQRKDPEIPVRVAVALCPWPGVKAEKVEELVTRKIDSKIAENEKVERIESTSRTGLSVVKVKLVESVKESGEIFDDINLKLAGIKDLPEGAGPIVFIKDFGDTATLMLTVASPKVGDVEIDLRARELETVIRELRSQAPKPEKGDRVSLAVIFPNLPDSREAERKIELLRKLWTRKGIAKDVLVYNGSGLSVLDLTTTLDDAELAREMWAFVHEELHASEISPDTWKPAVIVRDPQSARVKLVASSGSKYSLRDLEAFTDEIARTLNAVPIVSKVTRWGVQRETVFLEYSQERLASYELQPSRIKDILGARNVILPGGMLEFEGKNLIVDPSGEFKSERELGGTLISSTNSGAGTYLRDLVEMSRGYETPAQNLNYLIRRDPQGNWQRLRAITLAVTMRSGEQIGGFSKDVDLALERVKRRLPEDLVIDRTSDQPLQVRENVNLFMRSLYEAVILVVIVALIGFWEWRSALLMAISIPITLAMTFGMMHFLNVDLQQISIASLIIALGLLVDYPVVANDAIKQELDHGQPRDVASWVGPTKLAKAILYGTITNIVAYLPFLLLTGDTGRFLYTLPIVITCSLVASYIVSRTFVPFVGYYLLRPRKKPAFSMEELRIRGFYGMYYRVGSFLIDNRWKALLISLVPVVTGFWVQSQLKPQFFPKDLSYLSYVDLWLPEDASIMTTDEAAKTAEGLLVKAAADFGAKHLDKNGKPMEVLKCLTTFVGGGGPRFWFSVEPELSQANYAQILIEVRDKHLTNLIVDQFQKALMARLPGVRVDMRQLETGPPVGLPVQIRLSGEDMSTLRASAEKLKDIFRSMPNAYRTRDNWGTEIFQARLKINPDKANLAGVTNLDVARSSSAALNGFEVTNLREGRLTIPVMARLRMEERSAIGDIENLYVYAAEGSQKVPLGQISTIEYGMETERIERRNQFRTITVSCFPVPGVLPSEVTSAFMPKLEEFKNSLPPGYTVQIGGEYEEQVKGFDQMKVILMISVVCIFLALVFQFRSAIKPFIVFSALPYGMAGAFAALAVSGSPFGFMAFLGVISLIGVIVSHIIVLFDFIEEKLEEGEDLRTALLDAGIMRLRPVAITVAATVIALVPLATHGGPLWEPLCYAQIGGLMVATFVTLLIVPVLYSIAAFDLKILR
ncbi:MAG: efflux RND transporter permease subunit [Desulfomonilaceae bacterium]